MRWRISLIEHQLAVSIFRWRRGLANNKIYAEKREGKRGGQRGRPHEAPDTRGEVSAAEVRDWFELFMVRKRFCLTGKHSLR